MFISHFVSREPAAWNQLKRETLRLAATACILGSLASCAKEDIINPSQGVKPSSSVQNAVPAYPLNWETIDFMPTPACMPQIPVPWGSGASKQFTPELTHDYKKADGWELVYNTFNTQTCQDRYYFLLYNKYRGLLRMYYYLPSSTNLINSDNLVHKLGVEGAYAPLTPIMNFAAQPIVDVSSNSPSAVSIEPWQLAPATWYICQYELAYDQNLSAQDYTRLNFAWPLNALQVTKLELSGKLVGGVTGTLTLPGTNINLSPTISKSVSMLGEGAINVNGSSGATKLLPSLGSAVVSGLKKSITDGVSGIVSGVFSGIFSSKKSEENVNLKLNAQINLDGTLTSNVLVGAPALAVPGYSQAQTVTYTPAYNQPLGVFYLSGRPVINQQKFVSSNGQTLPTNAYSLSPDYEGNVAKLIINPAVSAIATIENITQEVVVIDNGFATMISGRPETINGMTYYFGSTLQFNTYPPAVSGLRISFDVVPKDGNPRVRLAKTFVPQVNEQVIQQNPGEDPF